LIPREILSVTSKCISTKIKVLHIFIIAKIMRPATKDNEKGYIIRWKGYKPAVDSFVPRTSLIVDVPKLLLLFEKDHDVVWKISKKQLYVGNLAPIALQ
jgi:hypothetical protein